LKASEMWIWRRMERGSWKDKVVNAGVLQRVSETRSVADSIWRRKHRHVLRHDGLLKGILEGKRIGKPVRGRKTLNLLGDLAEK